MSIIDRLAAAARALVLRPVEDAVRKDQQYSLPSMWSNYYTGLGTSTDRTYWHAPGAVTAVDDETLAACWQGDPIARTVIEAIVDDGMRAGFQVAYHGESETDPDLIPEVNDLAIDLDLEGKARLAAKAARALRGGGFILVVNGGKMGATQPLDDERIVSVDRIVTWDSRDLNVAAWTLDQHTTYTYSPPYIDSELGAQIHASHVVVFPGIDTPTRDRQQTWNGWYRPVLQVVLETIRDFRQSWQSAVAMMQDGSQGVLSLPDLARTLVQGGRSLLETRLALIQQYRWAGRIMPIDAGGGAVNPEKFEWVERSFNGISDLLAQHQPLVAQAAEMPLTRLFGDFSSAGLNNSGAGAERNWFATVQAWRRAHIEPPLNRVVRLLAKQQGASDWQRWCVEWPELEVLSSAERADLEAKEADNDGKRIEQGFPAEVILRHRFGGGQYSHSTPLLKEEDLADIEAAVEAEEEAQEEARSQPWPGEEGFQGEDPSVPEKGVTPPQLAKFAKRTAEAAAEETPDDPDDSDEDEDGEA